MTERARRAGRSRRRWAAASVFVVALAARSALADDPPPPRDVAFQWDYTRHLLHVSLSYRDVIDAKTDYNLTRGIPMNIVFTGTVYRIGAADPLSTTVQSCEIKYDVWKELFFIKVTRTSAGTTGGTGVINLPPVLTKEGVIKRCAEANMLLAGEDTQVPFGVPLYLSGQVQVDPIDPKILQQIQRWVSRPTGTATAGPAGALFSFFTGLFVQRIGNAARVLDINTKAVTPTVAPPPPPPPPPPKK